MALALADKKLHVDEISKRLEANKFRMLVDTQTLTVHQVEDLRAKLREKKIKLKVYKNRLIKRAIDEQGSDSQLAKLTEHLTGPTAMAFTDGDPIVAAKVFADYAEENKNLGLKAVVYEDQYWVEADIKEMVKLGSMAAIYGRLINGMKTPMRKLTNSLKWPGTKLTLTLKAAAEKAGQ